MSIALRLYEQLTEASEDKTRARIIADAFEQRKERFPHLKKVATQSQVRESELRLPYETGRQRTAYSRKSARYAWKSKPLKSSLLKPRHNWCAGELQSAYCKPL